MKRDEQDQADHEAVILREAQAIMARRGGAARARALSPAKRRAIARKGGLARAAARKRKGGK